MFSPNTSIKCEKEIQFHRIPEIYFDESRSDSQTYHSQTVPNSKNFPFIDNLNSKSVQCEYYIKNPMCQHSSSYEKFKFGKVNCANFGKINSNLTVNHHDLMNIGSLDETSHYPVDESINYEFDIPISLSAKEKISGLANVINGSNSDEIDHGNFCVV